MDQKTRSNKKKKITVQKDHLDVLTESIDKDVDKGKL